MALCEGPQSISIFPKKHTDFQNSSELPSQFESQDLPSWSFQLCFLFNAAQISSAFSLPSYKAAASSHQKFNGQTSYGRKPGGAEEWYPCIAASEDQLRAPLTADLFTSTVPASSSPESLSLKKSVNYLELTLSEMIHHGSSPSTWKHRNKRNHIPIVKKGAVLLRRRL